MNLLISLMVIALLLLVAAVVCAFLFSLADSSFINTVKADGVILDKEHHDWWMAGEVYMPEEWWLLIKVPEGYDWLSVNEGFYNFVNNGTPVTVEYGFGRYTGNVHVKNIWLKSR